MAVDCPGLSEFVSSETPRYVATGDALQVNTALVVMVNYDGDALEDEL